MYLHGFVVLPTPVTTLARHSVYELFFMNISETVLELVNGIHFSFLFHHDESQTRVTMTTIHVYSFGESSWYPADSPYYICNVFTASAIEQRVFLSEERLWEFRDQGRPFETRNSLTTLWSIVPYPVNPVNWFIFYNLLRNFLDDMYYGTILDKTRVIFAHRCI